MQRFIPALALVIGCSSNGGDPPPSPGPDGGTRPDGGVVVVEYTCTTTIHVATTGDDGSDGSTDAPLASIRVAAARATAGTCIRVRAGTYREDATVTFSADGTPSAPIVLLASDGPHTVTLDARDNDVGQAMYLTRDHVIIDGIAFTGTPTDTQQSVIHIAGLGMGKGRGIIVRNSTFTGGWDMIKINERAGAPSGGAADRIVIEHNDFTGTPGHLLVSLTGGYGVEFRDNHFHDAWSRASPADVGAIQVKGGSARAVFERNRFDDIHTLGGAIAFGDGCGGTCDIDPDHYAVVDSYAANNLFVNVGRAFDFGGARDCAAWNNTIIGSATQTVAFKLYPVTTGSTTRESLRVRIENNLVANPDGDLFGVIQINGASGTGLVMNHNLYFDGGDVVDHDESESLVVDPGLVSIGAGDFTPGVGSPAIGAGANLSSEFSGDFTRATRPATGAWTIGAIERP